VVLNLVIMLLQLNRVKDRLKEKKIDLRSTAEAVSLLGKLGFDPNFGARPVKRVIQLMVENEISMRMLQQDFNEGDTIILESSTEATDGLRIRKLERGQSIGS
jgi:ATP-dependent Clp protease ATP-binding subunit ClpB